MAEPILPPGFELIDPEDSIPPPPPGFEIDKPKDPYASWTLEEKRKWLDPSARPATQEEIAAGPSINQQIAETMRQTFDSSYKPAFGPELGDFSGSSVGAMSNAATLKGKLNIVRQMFPGASLDVDEYGRPGFRTGKETVMKGGLLGQDKTYPAGTFVYFDKPEITLSDFGDPKRFIENNITTLLAGASAAPARALTAMGATAGGAAFDELFKQVGSMKAGADEELNLGRIALSAAGAAAGEGAGRFIGWTASAVAKKVAGLLGEPVENVVKNGELTRGAKEALQKHGIDENDLTEMASRSLQHDIKNGLTPEQALRVQDFEKIGAKPTKGEVTQKFEDMAFEAETKKLNVGGGLRQRDQETNMALVKKLEDMRGGAKVDPEDIGSITKDALRIKKNEMQQEITKLYEELSSRVGSKRFMPIQLTGKMKELKKYDNLAPEIKSFSDGFAERFIKDGKIKPVSVDDAMILRQELEKLSGVDLRTNGWLRELKNSIDNDVLKLAPGFKAPIDAAKKKLQEFEPNVKLLSKYGEDATNIVQRLFEGKIDNREVMNVIVNKSGKTKDLEALKRSLLTGTKQQVETGKKVLDELKGGTFSHLIDNSVSKGAEDTLIFSGKKFADEIEKIGAKKLGILLSKEELAMLNTIRRVGEARIPVEGTVNKSGTVAAFLNYMGSKPGLKQLKDVYDLLKASKSLGGADVVRQQANEQSKQIIRNFRNRLLSPITSSSGAETMKSLEEP